MIKYTIKKGNHFACPPNFKSILFSQKINLSWEINLSPQCWYPSNAIPTQGLNKIVGIGFGLNHHQNSIRLGYQPDFDQEGKFRLYVYWYHNSKNFFYEFAHANANGNFKLIIKERNDGLFHIIALNSIRYFEHFVVSKRSKLGYLLNPYFGGRSFAPWDMTISVKKL